MEDGGIDVQILMVIIKTLNMSIKEMIYIIVEDLLLEKEILH